MSDPNPYEVLGVSKSASPDDIKVAYRNLAKKFHPDLNPGNKEAEHRFKAISAAYEKIGSPEARAKFDRGETQEQVHRRERGPFYYQTQNHGGARYAFFGGEEGAEGNVFESLFRGFRAETAPQPEHYVLELELEETVRETERHIVLPDGRKLAVKIPAGVTAGTTLRLKQPSMEALVEIHIRPSERFRTAGKDVLVDVSVPLETAVLGGEVRVPTLDGDVLMKIPPHVNTDSKLRLPSKGLFDRSRGRRGDQLVNIKVMLPTPLDPEIEEAIRHSASRKRAA